MNSLANAQSEGLPIKMIDNLREQIKNIKLLGGKSKFQFSLYYLLIFEEIDRGPLLISDALTFDASSTQ